jgi:hypothetical protein
MRTLELECPRCGSEVSARIMSCAVCGARNPHHDVGSIATGPSEAAALRARIDPAARAWISRFGLVPMIAALGVLPLYPLTPVVGILAGTWALFRVQRGFDPPDGRSLALAGIVGGLVWMVIGVALTTRAARFIQSAPFIPEPLKWFWSWGVGGG